MVAFTGLKLHGVGPDKSIFELLAKEIPNFSYWWEEEQGFGEEWECVNGELRLISELGFASLERQLRFKNTL